MIKTHFVLIYADLKEAQLIRSVGLYPEIQIKGVVSFWNLPWTGNAAALETTADIPRVVRGHAPPENCEEPSTKQFNWWHLCCKMTTGKLGWNVSIFLLLALQV